MVNFRVRSLFYFSDILGSFQFTEYGAGATSGTPAATSAAPPTRPPGCLDTEPAAAHTPRGRAAPGAGRYHRAHSTTWTNSVTSKMRLEGFDRDLRLSGAAAMSWKW